MAQLTLLRSPLLVLGPAHAGKSDIAAQALAPDRPATVIGTARASERAFAARLEELKGKRPGPWDSVDLHGTDLAGAVEAAAAKHPQVLVDSVNQWLAGLLVSDSDNGEEQIAELADAQVGEILRTIAKRPQVRFVFVSSEAGAGPAPARALERLYRQLNGLVNQRLAGVAAAVVTVTAGIPQVIKVTPSS